MPPRSAHLGWIDFNLTIRNAGAVAANFYQMDEVLQTEAKKLVREAARFMHDLTYFYSPVDTGFMQQNIRIRYSEQGLAFEVGWYEEDFISAGLAFYPVFQEFGTRYMAAQPSLLPAYEETKSWFVPALSEALSAAIARQSGGIH